MITRDLSVHDVVRRAWLSILSRRSGRAVRFVIRDRDHLVLGECCALLPDDFDTNGAGSYTGGDAGP
jgi:hypothetical protein